MSGINPNLRQFDPLSSSSTAGSQRLNPGASAGSSSSYPTHTPQTPAFSMEQVKYLKNQGFSTGMIRALHTQKHSFPLRVWILDNSSSMFVRDAHLLRGGGHDHVTRWDELRDCITFHADLAARFLLPTRFALLNAPSNGQPQYFSLAQAPGNLANEQQILHSVLSQVIPNGPSPLTVQLQILYNYIVSISPELRAKHQTVPIIITTQGVPTNNTGESSVAVVQEFVQCLTALQALPVSLVLRLCTDDEKAMDFYNSLDSKVPLVDVLDDYYGEALEAYLRNPWLTYGLALHRYREMGFRVPALDSLDEHALTLHELRDLCLFLFDEPTFPDPSVDWNGFVQRLAGCLHREPSQWNPVKKAMMPWIDMAHLNQVYGGPASQFPRPSPNFTPPARAPYHTGFTPSAASNTAVPPTAPPSFPKTAPPTHPASSAPPALDALALIKAIDVNWGKQPPAFATIRPLPELLSTVDVTFPLVKQHEHFTTKFQPFSPAALSTGGNDVMKRAVRKMRFFLHPDRLPKDFTEQQSVLCRTLWDTISDSWDAVSEKTN
jgi:hypothetical protein